jgi:hypothetical protein
MMKRIRILCNAIALVLILCLSIGAQGQVIQKVVTLAGTDGIVNGTGIGAHFFSPWHVVLRDSILLISDQEAGAVRRMSLKTKKVTTLFANQPAISGMALTRSKDSLYFSSNGNILKLYRFSTQTITILDTLVETPIDAMICTRNGNLIFSGGNSHRVGMRTPAGVYSRLAGKMNTSGNVDGIDTVARFNTISAFALSQTEDTLYISDRFNSKIRRLNRVTKTVSTLPFVAALGLFGPRNLALNPKKDSLFVANFSNHTILRYSLKTNTGAIWCGGNTISGYVDGQGTQARFFYPNGLVRTDSGFVVADWVNQRIRLISFGGRVKTIAGMGKIANGTGTNSRFYTPNDIIKHPRKDTVYVSDQFNHVIRSINLKNNNVRTLVGDGVLGNIFGIGEAARLNRPTGMAISQTGDTLYTVEPFTNKIKLILTKTGEVKWLAGSDTAGYVDKLQGKFSRFNQPRDIALKGNLLYVADAQNHKIRTVNVVTTEVKTYAGSTQGFKDSTLLFSRFNRPITLEWVENKLFIGEDAGLRIRVLNPETGLVQNWAGNGSLGNVDGLGSGARFRGILKMNYNPINRLLYVGGYSNEGFFRAVGVDVPNVTTITQTAGYVDGDLADARFTGPSGICLDSARRQMLVADAGNNRIRAVRYFPNTAPKATLDTSITFLEDAGMVNRPGFAQNMTVGTTLGDTLQTYSFSFAQPQDPRISGGQLENNGNLSIQAAPDANGDFYFRIRMKDNGGTVWGGIDSTILSTHIHITPVNDPPVFTTLGNDTAYHLLPRIKTGYITAVSPGPSDEFEQTTQFTISVNKPERFLVQPFIDNGALRFTPKQDSLGPVAAQIRCSDNGGTANGGVDVSGPQNFTIFIWDPTMVKDLKANRLVIYPNPSQGKVNLVNPPSGTTGLRFTNSMGQLVWECTWTEGQTQVELPTFLKGVLVVQTIGYQTRTGRLVIY